jgi:hypothetical protein
MKPTTFRFALGGALLAALSACGGSGNTDTGSSLTPTQQMGTVPVVVSDDSSSDWATIGVKILSVALVPQGGGSPVTVYTAPSTAPYVNLVQLDQIGEILGNLSVPVGTYTGAILTVGGNPGDVVLVTAADPEAGFAGAPSTQIPSADIQIQHTQGSTGSLTVPVKVTFDSPLSVTTSSNNALDLEFDLSHPAFIVAHQPPGSSSVLWAVNFNGPIRHHPVADITHLALRHLYATLGSVSSDGSTITVTRDYPTLPLVSPETDVATSQSLNIQIDSTNGTLFYDLDTGTRSTIKSASGVTGLSAGAFLRIAARYQPNGSVVATRIWASSTFNNVWLSPEGHVLDVNPATGIITVMNAAGQPVQLQIDNSTQFFFHDGSTAIGTGLSFLTAGNLVRGFKIDATVNPLATTSPRIAQEVNIETAAYSGAISGANTSSFTYTHDFVRSSNDYSVTLNYISGSTPNGTDANGNAIAGFKWWDFAFPTVINSGSAAIPNFVNAVTTAPPLTPWGVSYAVWGDPANTTGWSAPVAVLLPVPLPLATVSNPFASGSFSETTSGASPQTYKIDVSSTGGQATLVYQVDRTNGVVSVSPVDLTTSTGLSTFTNAMLTGTPVKVFGTPQADGSLQAYVVLYFTGTLPQS